MSDRTGGAGLWEGDGGGVLSVASREPWTEQRRIAMEVARRALEERGCGASQRADAVLPRVVLSTDASMDAESYRLADGDRPGAVDIRSGSDAGLLYGLGRYLRDGCITADGFQPGGWRGLSSPGKPVRGIYCSTHFHNFYHAAPIEEVTAYIEGLALWGCNALAVRFNMSHFTGMDDPAASAMTTRLHDILGAARRVGMRTGLLATANEAFRGAPESLRAPRSWLGAENCLCPAHPEGLAMILDHRRQVLEALRETSLDFLVLWPYDEGGCPCPACSPWGTVGYPRLGRRVAELVKAIHPRAAIVLSTWCFDFGETTGELAGLWEALKTDADWIDYIMADAHNDFPYFVIKHGAPADKPMLNFMEISMHDMYPFGGFGANPIPRAIQRKWDMSRDLLAGGFPYSEGIFEDMNKAMALQLFWTPEMPVLDALRVYAAFEFGAAAAEDVARAAELLEDSLQPFDHNFDRALAARLGRGEEVGEQERLYHLRRAKAPERIVALLDRAEETMTPAARGRRAWRVLRLRAALDLELTRSGGRSTAAGEAYFEELTRWYHAEHALEIVAPPGRRALRRLFAGKGEA